jgi:hypothetical protein
MEKDHAQGTFQLRVLFVAHVIDLLGNVEDIDLGEAAGAQQRRLLDRPQLYKSRS